MRCIVIGGGNVGEYVNKYVKSGDFVICADSGYDYAKRYGVPVDLVIGDMDSVQSEISDEKTMIYPTHKDFTDSELCVKYAREHKFDSVLLFGMIGTRMDHTLANLSLLKQLENARIIDSHNEIILCRKKVHIIGKKGDTISLIPFDGDAEDVTTSGLYYSLCGDCIKSGTGLGVSNVMTEDECCVTVGRGKLFVIRSRD